MSLHDLRHTSARCGLLDLDQRTEDILLKFCACGKCIGLHIIDISIVLCLKLWFILFVLMEHKKEAKQ